MVKTGFEYAFSKEKRRLDLIVAGLMVPGARLSQLALMQSTGFQDDRLMRQKRVGANEEMINIYKLETLDQNADEEGILHPINSRAENFRRLGIDELIQYRNIREGTMSAVGRRPLLKTMYDESFEGVSLPTIDAYIKNVVPTRPGIVDSYGLAAKLGTLTDGSNQEMMEMQIKDVVDGSVGNDIRLIASAVAAVAFNKMKTGTHGVALPDEL